VIVRKPTFVDAEDDAINVGQESHHIWIDHHTFRRPVRSTSCADRIMSRFRGSFAATDKSMLVGHSDGAASSDTGRLLVGIHHNFFDNSRQRHPRVRFGERCTSTTTTS
jgi:pectate lyase